VLDKKKVSFKVFGRWQWCHRNCCWDWVSEIEIIFNLLECTAWWWGGSLYEFDAAPNAWIKFFSYFV